MTLEAIKACALVIKCTLSGSKIVWNKIPYSDIHLVLKSINSHDARNV
jgi:hypothetical protein